MTETITIAPHHPDCRYPHGPNSYSGHDPERCCYCAALIRGERDPLDYRYGGPGCGCGPRDEALDGARLALEDDDPTDALAWIKRGLRQD